MLKLSNKRNITIIIGFIVALIILLSSQMMALPNISNSYLPDVVDIVDIQLPSIKKVAKLIVILF